ncbi:Amino acid transporter [Proteiniphilum saccharofermentans]|uniref:Amino acid transporter n=1 Tax=Proteiniphilum saccharofermentans TaxID=1642647 RepID=A0A1R3T3L0_9BACT|nr:amino acid permease [Proteiniphilum saccharofermentans]SCD20682.1 Amino acid transporter [Proteiniphilum saccharofermentans]
MKEKVRHTDLAAPAPALRLIDAIVLIVGIVIGAGIFRTPSVVAANSPDQFWFAATWVLGGIISLTGALCYSELSSAFPNAGGDYHFLKTAFGKRFSFLFAWSRVTVTQTGSIAILAYIAGDYLAELLPLGTYSSAFYAGAIVISLTLVNILGIRFGTGLQKLFMALQIIGILIIVLAGFLVEPSTTVQMSSRAVDIPSNTSIGLALIFVLLTFGGWNEAAYISAELKTGSRKMALVLVTSILIITLVYLLMNLAFLNVLGLSGMAASEAVGVDMMRATLGEKGVILIGLLVSIFALTSLNTTIFTGARANYALGKDFSPLAFLGKWDKEKSSPVNSLILQGVIAVVLIVFGAFTRNGFEAMVDFTAPVFWFFFLCTGLSLFVLRKKQPDVPRPFKVPLYPVIPFLFVAFCAYMLYSSLSVTGTGALVGVALLLTGWGVSFFRKPMDDIR